MFGYTVIMLDGSSGGKAMTEKCCICEKDFIVCTHAICGDTAEHSECGEYGCGECMVGCSGSPSEEECVDCVCEGINDAMVDRAVRRAEDGWRDA